MPRRRPSQLRASTAHARTRNAGGGIPAAGLRRDTSTRPGLLIITMDLWVPGWLEVDVDDGRGVRQLLASDLTLALDDLLTAMISLTRGAPRARVSWDAEPTEFRWLCTVDSDGDARLRILVLADRAADAPEHEGRPVVDVNLPLHVLVRSVTAAARSLLTYVGEAGYARLWAGRPFPASQLRLLERWPHNSRA